MVAQMLLFSTEYDQAKSNHSLRPERNKNRGICGRESTGLSTRNELYMDSLGGLGGLAVSVWVLNETRIEEFFDRDTTRLSTRNELYRFVLPAQVQRGMHAGAVRDEMVTGLFVARLKGSTEWVHPLDKNGWHCYAIWDAIGSIIVAEWHPKLI